MSNKLTTFAERLKFARESRKESCGLQKVSMYSQVAVAKKIPLARQTYIDLELGNVEPRIGIIERLSDILDIDKAWLAWGDSSPSKFPPFTESEINALNSVANKMQLLMNTEKKATSGGS